MRRDGVAEKRAFCRFMAVVCLGLLSHACEDARGVYAPQEREAVERFEAVLVGSRETDLREKLGVPTCIVSLERLDQESLTVRCPVDAEPRTVSRSRREEWPWELSTLSIRIQTRRILVYVDGTVFAHYFLDEDGMVRVVEVKVS